MGPRERRHLRAAWCAHLLHEPRDGRHIHGSTAARSAAHVRAEHCGGCAGVLDGGGGSLGEGWKEGTRRVAEEQDVPHRVPVAPGRLLLPRPVDAPGVLTQGVQHEAADLVQRVQAFWRRVQRPEALGGLCHFRDLRTATGHADVAEYPDMRSARAVCSLIALDTACTHAHVATHTELCESRIACCQVSILAPSLHQPAVRCVVNALHARDQPARGVRYH
mmetsp:Transcript_87172/g.241725  ORF Transcript_87172/g.241725 Transcript_87172/m.241725 type:complete len:220 (+) Transcript_87172:792-1451(+)